MTETRRTSKTSEPIDTGGATGAAILRVVSASTWVDDLKAAIRDYSQTRRTGPPVVRVTLTNNESRYILSASTGPRDELISLDLYPENAGDLLDVERPVGGGEVERDRVTREVLVVHPIAIRKFELLDEHPGERGFGFAVEAEPD
jgi:hypothetical protein